MAQIEFTIKTYDQTGLIKTETYMAEEPLSLEQKIEQKERDLIKIYNQIEELKSLSNE